MASDDWSSFEDRLEARMRKSRRAQAHRQSGKSVFMLKQLMSRSKKASTPNKRKKR